ncbi:hypothetical protein [uncultured Xanthomonas sp.]|uniref:hypothetical protein n=1 Tax=uncultured Xanthomonas sp. TaxID=152831 RepID=UPI0025EEB90D|nr:hypothetical protein [uncultured Xanthomonas sp.]
MHWIERSVAIGHVAITLALCVCVQIVLVAAFAEGDEDVRDLHSPQPASSRSAAVCAASEFLRQRGLPWCEMRLVAWCGSQRSCTRDERRGGRSDRESSRD